MAPDLKKRIVQKILEQLERDLKLIQEAAVIAREAATHEESRAEDKYDTRGLEASYLAGAQAKRASEIEAMIFNYRHLELKPFSPESAIAATALVELESEGSGRKSLYFIAPKGGAMAIDLEGQKINVITTVSPLAEALEGRHVGEDFVLATPKSQSAYTICGLS